MPRQPTRDQEPGAKIFLGFYDEASGPIEVTRDGAGNYLVWGRSAAAGTTSLGAAPRMKPGTTSERPDYESPSPPPRGPVRAKPGTAFLSPEEEARQDGSGGPAGEKASAIERRGPDSFTPKTVKNVQTGDDGRYVRAVAQYGAEAVGKGLAMQRGERDAGNIRAMQEAARQFFSPRKKG